MAFLLLHLVACPSITPAYLPPTISEETTSADCVKSIWSFNKLWKAVCFKNSIKFSWLEEFLRYKLKIAKETFSENSSGSNLPSFKIQKSTLDNKMNIIDLIILSGLENSKSEVRRLINGNAIKIDNEIVKDQNFQINQGLLKNNFIKLSIGKKRHLKIEIN